ncbi:MAG: hypothetical protein DRI69_10070 [Bacteroidetes bacterium]|nr:MAG: hypothetical protein DRI69_10070 [Bacteroidota bacterium]
MFKILSDTELTALIESEFKLESPSGTDLLMRINDAIGETEHGHAGYWYAEWFGDEVDRLMADRDLPAANKLFRKYLEFAIEVN